MSSSNPSQRELSQQNDADLTNNLRDQILQDMLKLHEVDWRRQQTISNLNEIRKRSLKNKKQKDQELKRENEINAIRMQPYIQKMQAGMKKDILLLREKEPQWKRLYTSVEQLKNTINQKKVSLNLIKDDKLHLELLTSTMPGIQDPVVENTLQLANNRLTSAYLLRCKVLKEQLEKKEKSNKYFRDLGRLLRDVLDAKVAAKVTDGSNNDEDQASLIARAQNELDGAAKEKANADVPKNTEMMKMVYQKLKNVIGIRRDTVKVRSFRHALSRQSGGGDATPTGMISTWSYDSTTDKYTYPQGHSGTGVLTGLILGAVDCQEMKRYDLGNGTTFVGRKSPTTDVSSDSSSGNVGSSDCSLLWKFAIDSNSASTITLLRVRASSSTVGKERVQWSIKGGTNNSENQEDSNDNGGLTVSSTYIPKTICRKIGSNSYVDVSKHAVGWNWFELEATVPRSTEKDVHFEDVQLFRSTSSSKVKPQLSIQLGLSLCNDENDTNKGTGSKQEIEAVLKECEENNIGKLGNDAALLMERGKGILAKLEEMITTGAENK
jgi:hypothetical protein